MQAKYASLATRGKRHLRTTLMHMNQGSTNQAGSISSGAGGPDRNSPAFAFRLPLAAKGVEHQCLQYHNLGLGPGKSH